MKRLMFTMLYLIVVPGFSQIQESVQTEKVIFYDPVKGNNTGPTYLYRVDQGNDNVNLRVRLGDDHFGQFEVGYNEFSNGEWKRTFSITNDGDGFVDRDFTTGGDLYLGENIPDAINGYGRRLVFWGASDNEDGLYMSRYNYGPDKSALRENIGNDSDGYDKFVVGNHHYSDGDRRPHFTVNNQGLVGIGTDAGAYSGYRLSVVGKIRAEEIKVYTDWSDFVFLKGYRLRSLQEVEIFIQENGHLPEIPSAAEVEENGINLGEMDAKLLQKIEELTLYVIELKKEIDILKEERTE